MVYGGGDNEEMKTGPTERYHCSVSIAVAELSDHAVTRSGVVLNSSVLFLAADSSFLFSFLFSFPFLSSPFLSTLLYSIPFLSVLLYSPLLTSAPLTYTVPV